MSNKEELELWVKAASDFDQENYDLAIANFNLMDDSAKKFFNLGVVHTRNGDTAKAQIQCYSEAVRLDRYLAVAYFQRGVVRMIKQENQDALDDFNEALKCLRGNQFIDYTQIGLVYKMYSCEIYYNRALCNFCLGDEAEARLDLERATIDRNPEEERHVWIQKAIEMNGMDCPLFCVPRGVLYRPDMSKVKNATKVDYLGSSKVIAAIKDEELKSQEKDSGTTAGGGLKRSQTLGFLTPRRLKSTLSHSKSLRDSFRHRRQLSASAAQPASLAANGNNDDAASASPPKADKPSSHLQLGRSATTMGRIGKFVKFSDSAGKDLEPASSDSESVRNSTESLDMIVKSTESKVVGITQSASNPPVEIIAELPAHAEPEQYQQFTRQQNTQPEEMASVPPLPPAPEPEHESEPEPEPEPIPQQQLPPQPHLQPQPQPILPIHGNPDPLAIIRYGVQRRATQKKGLQRANTVQQPSAAPITAAATGGNNSPHTSTDNLHGQPHDVLRRNNTVHHTLPGRRDYYDNGSQQELHLPQQQATQRQAAAVEQPTYPSTDQLQPPYQDQEHYHHQQQQQQQQQQQPAHYNEGRHHYHHHPPYSSTVMAHDNESGHGYGTDHESADNGSLHETGNFNTFPLSAAGQRPNQHLHIDQVYNLHQNPSSISVSSAATQHSNLCFNGSAVPAPYQTQTQHSPYLNSAHIDASSGY
ncbi:hypothetical protein EV182_002701, partial [Spiromyces aspiralis]